MRNLKKFLVITAAFVMMFCNILQAFAAARYIKPEMVNTEAVKTTGRWNKDADGHWSFTPNGENPVRGGWFYLNSSNTSTEYKWYCFDENGIMRTGWIVDKNDSSVWYYAGETKDAAEGCMITGWITDPQDGRKYYLDPATGIMVHGWRQIDGKWYYFGERQYADRSWTPDNTGHMTAGAKGTHSYGSMYANEYTPDGYYVGPDGVWNGISSGSSSSGRHDPVVKTYTVTFNMNGHGTAPGPQKVKSGSTISEPAPQPSAEGYIFGGWFKESACINRWNFASDKVTASISLFAKWSENDHITIIYQSEASNKGTVSPTSESLNPVVGTATGSKASPSDGYRFINWTDAAGNVVGTSETFVPEKKDGKYAEETYTAHFDALIHKVTAQVQGSHGNAVVRVGDTEVAEAGTGENVTFTATPGEDYEFDCWEIVSGGINIDSIKTNNTITVTMPATALTLKAHFKAIIPSEYNIILEDDGHGLAIAKVGEREVTFAAPDALVTLVATPNEGYAFKEWNIVRGLSDGAINDNTFTMPSNEVKIKAIFDRAYNISVQVQGHGSASATVDGRTATCARKDASVTLTATPEDGYELKGWTVVSGDITISNNAFTMPEGNVTVKAVFSEAPVSVLNYMVSIWDIDSDGSVIFGPAVGSALSVECDSQNDHCIHRDLWDEIIHNIQNGHADYYYDCLATGCTHSVEITGNSVFTTSEGRCSVLYNSVNESYRKWNNDYSSNDCESANYATSRIRATLNGYNNTIDPFTPSPTYAGTNCLSETNCLFSCFPRILQENITARKINVPTQWNTTSPYAIQNSVTIRDKLWLANANEIYGSSCGAAYIDYGVQFAKNSGKSSTDYTVYDENGKARGCWLRSPYRSSSYYAAGIHKDGHCAPYNVTNNSCGISPFFMIGGSAPETYTYQLKGDGNGSWIQDGATMESFETTDAALPVVDESGSITYTGTDGQEHTVTATPNTGYTFKECSYDTNTKTYTASFETISYDIGCAVDGQEETYEVIIGSKEKVIDSPIKINGTDWYYSAFRQTDKYGFCTDLYVSLKKGGFPSSRDYDYAIEVIASEGYQLVNCEFGNITITGIEEDPHTGQVTASQNLTAEVEPVPVVTTYTLITDGNGTWKEGLDDVTSFETTDRPEAGETITYKDTDGIRHEVKAIPEGGYTYDSCSYYEATRTFYAVFKEKESLSMLNLQPEDEELSEKALDSEVIIEDIPTEEEIIEEDKKTHEFNEVETENTSKVNEPEEEITTDGKSDEDNPDEKPIENLPSAGIINSDPANSSEIKEKPQNDSTEQTEHQ